ncbi:MAG: hypothetical protein LBT47_10570 [Deltaproteobacteria bacterium]|jgi:hypothetical protein|nr:hypothetical protein [Deltaproteobacteria bacterium]
MAVKKELDKLALEVEARLWANPLATIEVDRLLAEHMGMFMEDAVALEDFNQAEPGSMDWFFGPLAGPAGGQTPSRSGGDNGVV